MPTVPQTSVIFFALLIGFIVFITLRPPVSGVGPAGAKGELQQYLAVIGLEGTAAGTASGAATNATGRTGGIGVQTPAGGVTVSV